MKINNVKGISELNFRIHKNLSIAKQPVTFPELEPPAPKAATDAEAWKRFLRRTFNFYYGCATEGLRECAVVSLRLRARAGFNAAVYDACSDCAFIKLALLKI